MVVKEWESISQNQEEEGKNKIKIKEEVNFGASTARCILVTPVVWFNFEFRRNIFRVLPLWCFCRIIWQYQLHTFELEGIYREHFDSKFLVFFLCGSTLLFLFFIFFFEYYSSLTWNAPELQLRRWLRRRHRCNDDTQSTLYYRVQQTINKICNPLKSHQP